MALDSSSFFQRSVDSIQRIYAVVIALAIAQAIQSLLKEPTAGTDLGLIRAGLPSLVGFVVTLVPFWHGMNRHLDRCYLEKTEGVQQGALVFDFLMFFIEACFLFAAAWTIRFGLEAFYCLGGLLVVDMAWGLISHLIHFPGQKSHAVRWSLINMVAIGIAGFVIAYPFGSKPALLMGVAIIRSVADYGFCRKFYFPAAS